MSQAPPAAEAAPSPARFRFLRYWSVNVWLARSGGWSAIPGFPYTADEAARMTALATAASRGAIIAWLASTVAIYILLGGVLIGGVMGAALTLLWPNPADVSASGFFGLLILALIAMIAFGMPLSIGLGGAVADGFWKSPTPPAPGDAALAAKVGGQFRRMGLILGVLVVIAAIGWNVLLGGR